VPISQRDDQHDRRVFLLLDRQSVRGFAIARRYNYAAHEPIRFAFPSSLDLQTMSIYLDNAATSFPKPECVYQAVDEYQRNNGRPVGRGSSTAVQELQHSIDRCRLRAAELLGAKSNQQIVFTFNCTDSLNQVFYGTLQPGDHVVTSAAEHNSVLRPLRHLEQTIGLKLTVVDIDEYGFIDLDAIRNATTSETKMVVVQHVSNVTGAIQPIDQIAEIASEKNVLLAVDAAQSAGHLPLNVSDWNADFVACAGHKGLLGPLGTGLLYMAPGREKIMQPIRRGGTGSRSELDVQPDSLPDRFESGNQNAPGLVGLDAALGFLTEHTVQAIEKHERALTETLVDSLAQIESLTIHRAPDSHRHTGVVSVSSALYTSDELATILDEHFEIDTRAGLHCAPGIHRRMGTIDRQGTVRLSVGVHSTESEIAQVVDAFRQVSAV
jgi:cysteine desulfurase family protein